MKRKYDAEFKRNTVQKVLDGQSVASVSRELGVGEGLIHKWKKDHLQNSSGRQSSSELSEIGVLKKRNRELEMEVEILSDPLCGIFGRGS